MIVLPHLRRAAAAAFCLALTVAVPAGAAPAPSAVASIAVFGDSLSDVGSYRGATGDPANPGRFTVNPGTVWVQDIAARYGLPLTPNRELTLDAAASGITGAGVGTARVLGGTGYAEGGARVDRRPSQSGVGNNSVVAPVTDQLDRYLRTHGRFPADQLVIIDGGTNDLYAQLSDLCWGTDNDGRGVGRTTRAAAAAAVDRAAGALAGAVRRIKSAGGGTVLVAGAMDFSRTPFGRANLTPAKLAGCTEKVSAGILGEWSARFNAIVRDGVSGLERVRFVDFTDTFRSVLDDPARYGLTNVTDTGCTNTKPTSSSVFCTRATLAAPDADRTYLWSDDFHPSPRGHRILADRALAELRPLVG